MKVSVRYNSQSVGSLSLTKRRTCLFEYDHNWIEKGFSISPFFLPLKQQVFEAKYEPFDGLFGVFADSMPDGWGNLLLDRFLKSKGLELGGLNVLDRLSFVGENGMGALSYYPDNSFTVNEKKTDLNFIASQVSLLLSEQADLPTVKDLLELTGSSGGARPKVLIRYKGEAWMVKFPARYDSIDIGRQEFFYAQLARKCGIEMSETKLFEEKYFGTKLFDREAKLRFHVHSAAGLLHASHRYASLDYKQLAQLTIMLTKELAEMEKLLRLMVFNVAIGNKDDHAKNFSFIYKKQGWVLSPAYDLLKSAAMGDEHTTSVLGKGKPERKDMLALASEIDFPQKKMQKIIDEVFDICLASR